MYIDKKKNVLLVLLFEKLALSYDLWTLYELYDLCKVF